MKIIGHRGAAGLALENTIASIKAAKRAGVDAIEFDIRLTSDQQFVLCHDQSLSRVSDQHHVIKDAFMEHISEVLLNNGERMPTLKEALDAAGETPVIIEAKGSNWATKLSTFLDNYRPIDAKVASFNHRELGKFAKLSPGIPAYAAERTNPFDAIQFANQNNFAGVDMNFWILNPLTYWMARQRNLDIVVYTVNFRWIAWYINVFFPHVSIVTNHPHAMQFLRPRTVRGVSKTSSKT